MLICDNVSFARGGVPILEHVGFCLKPGGFLLIKGPNGSGKTSFMRTLAGLAAPVSGGITWRGEDVRNNDIFRQSLIYVGHANAVKTECTVEENIRFWANCYDTHAMALPAMHYFGLSDKKHIACGRLSAGWQKRVALSRLLLSPAPLWLLDEPTNYLDKEGIALVGSLIETRVQHEGIVIVASHAVHSSFDAHILMMEDFAPCSA